jgi:hypothetical protein
MSRLIAAGTFLSVLGISVATSAGTVPSESEAWCVEAVAALRDTLRIPPEQQAARAIKARDFRYLEWHGLGSMIPGVKSQDCARNANIIKSFEGTSDALCSLEHGRLQEASYPYAEAYNRFIAAEREARGLPSCVDA